MLVLKRKPEQNTVVTHKSGDVLVIRVNSVDDGRVQLGFTDPERHFDIQREERAEKAASRSAGFETRG